MKADFQMTKTELIDALQALRSQSNRHQQAGQGMQATLNELRDIQMPEVDGVEVLRQVKADAELRKLPVIILTTTDDPREVARCHDLGCSNYIVKPVDYEKFSESIKQLGLFISLVQVPEVNGRPAG